MIDRAGHDRVRRRVEEALAASGLVFPRTWNARLLCDRLAERRGRPLHLVPGSRFGWWHDHVWIAGRNADFIVWADRSSPVHQRHGVLHEIGHLVLGHSGVRLDNGTTRLADIERAVRSRAGYRHVDEIEAECFATVTGLRMGPATEAAPLDPRDAEAVEGLAQALGLAR
ncbi:hypothetical protein ACQPW3_15860 [Actinosynnema sp. CA-248983]